MKHKRNIIKIVEKVGVVLALCGVVFCLWVPPLSVIPVFIVFGVANLFCEADTAMCIAVSAVGFGALVFMVGCGLIIISFAIPIEAENHLDVWQRKIEIYNVLRV